jgi:outer membrane PBP1 activator LpoA protein
MLTPKQQAEEQRLQARVAFARSEYFEALKALGPLSRTVLEALCFLRGEESELQGFYFDMKESRQ